MEELLGLLATFVLAAAGIVFLVRRWRRGQAAELGADSTSDGVAFDGVWDASGSGDWGGGNGGSWGGGADGGD